MVIVIAYMQIRGIVIAIATTSIKAVCKHILTQAAMLLHAMLLSSNTKL